MSKAIAKSGVLRALGAMSGTSLDGVDVAVLETDGHQVLAQVGIFPTLWQSGRRCALP